jgi:hypothetical protein
MLGTMELLDVIEPIPFMFESMGAFMQAMSASVNYRSFTELVSYLTSWKLLLDPCIT